MQTRGAALVSLLFLLFPASMAVSEPPVRILFISRGGLWFNLMAQDPAISTFWIPVPGHSHIELLGQDPGVLHRIMRVYMPRRVEDLLAKYNMIILQECPYASTAYESLWFKDSWVMMFVEAIRDHGLSLEMWGGDASWGGGAEGFYTSWEDTMLGPLLPAKGLGGYNHGMAVPQRVVFEDAASPLARLPWGECPPVELNNAVELKDGAHSIAKVVYQGNEWPYIFDWEYGEGFVVGETQVVHSLNTLNLMITYWEYFPDFVTYLAYYGARRKIPDDIVLVKRIRSQIQRHYAERSMIISVLDFAERFGADVSGAYADIGDIDRAHEAAEELYLEEDYEGTDRALDDIQEMWRVVGGKAIRLKDRALLWVYVIEYLVVAGVSLISGVALWTLMVGRRLYREVSFTRLEPD